MPSPADPAATGGQDRPPRHPVVAWGVRLLLLAFVVVLVTNLVRSFRTLDLETVGQALGHLHAWHLLVLGAVLVLRCVLNAAPLAIHLPGVGVARATVNDLGAYTASAFVPAPSDSVLRVAMFRSWGVAVPQAVTATTMNALTMFVVRFSTPLVGFALLPFLGVPLGLRALDLLSLLVAAVIVVGVLLVVRAEGQAAAVGRRLGALVHRVRPAVRPESWAESFRSFQQQVAAGFGGRFTRGIAATAAMVLVDLLLLTLCLRFVGIGADEVPVHVLAGAFFFAYPLTMFPLQGIGIVDSAVTAALVEAAGSQVAEPVVAALLIWRCFGIAGPLLLGLGALAVWRRSTRGGGRAAG